MYIRWSFLLHYCPPDTDEEVEIEGIVSKLLELFLVIGITFIIKWDRKKAKMDLIRLSGI
jgi:hypothetical protein